MKALAFAFGAGLLFGAGLILAGMTDPQNIIGFLDFTGSWRPALALVMVGAIGVHALALRLFRAKSPSVLVSSLPPPALIDRPLLLGSVLFGIGWGLGGYCPGPAIVSIGASSSSALLFAGALLLGMLAVDLFQLRVSGAARARSFNPAGSHG